MSTRESRYEAAILNGTIGYRLQQEEEARRATPEFRAAAKAAKKQARERRQAVIGWQLSAMFRKK